MNEKQGDKAERLVPESEESVTGGCTTAGLDTSANQTFHRPQLMALRSFLIIKSSIPDPDQH
jgi:hypothetical protein